MGTRSLATLIAGIVWCAAAPAHADPKADVSAKARAAMASYDSMDYEAARRLLNQALAIAKRAKLDKDPIVARVYLDLGIAQLAGSDQEAAKVAFLSAAQIDPKITIDAAYKSAELVKMLEDAKAAAGDTGDAPDAGAECKAVRGLQHNIIDSGHAGAAQPIEALVGSELSPAKVVVMFRPEGAIDFTEVKLGRQAGCHFTGAIPASAMHGALVHYYIAAYDANNKVLAAKGSSGSPNILELSAASGGTPGDTEDPINGPARPVTSGGGPVAGVSRSAHGGAKTPSIMLAVSGGTGFGYVSGKTEGDNVVQTCCIGSSLAVITPEIAYYASPRLALGLAIRIGFPIGANISGHSTIAPSAFFRLRYALSRSGEGLRIMAELGGGVLRNTLKLSDDMSGMDTDIVAQGPLLVGAGLGYSKRLGSSLAFFVDLAAISGIAVVDKVGSAVHLNTGLSADLALGLAVGF
jgi:hypothetical protein